MKDPELIELRNKYLLGILVSIVFLTPLFFFLYNHFISKNSLIVERIQRGESFMLLIHDKDYYNRGKMVRKVLKKYDIDYEVSNLEKDYHYEEILKILKLSSSDIKSPTLMYIEKGELISTLPNIQKEEEVISFIGNYNESRSGS
jgi:glutaredoxin